MNQPNQVKQYHGSRDPSPHQPFLRTNGGDDGAAGALASATSAEKKQGNRAPRGPKVLNCIEGCANGAVRGGFCITHGAKVKQCSHKGCANRSKMGGVCITHGAKVKRCSNKGCANGAVRGGFCVTHGARTKLCSHKGCAKQARKGGLYLRHGKYSIASAAQNGAARPPHPAGGYDATAVVATAIAGVGGGEIELDTRNLQADVRCASSPRIMAPNFSDDNEDIIGAWIWRSSRMARLISVNNSDSAL